VELRVNQVRSGFAAEEPPSSSAHKFHRRILLPETGPASLLQLLIVSFASLFVEVLLIRWIGTEFRLFAYIQNLTLVACFLGFGLGCLRVSWRPRYLFDFWSLSFLVLVIDVPRRDWKVVLDLIASGLSGSSEFSVWAVANSGATIINFLIGAAMVSGILLLVIATMVPLGAWVAFCLESSKRPVVAYSVNLLGSLIGIWGFAALSFLRLAPIFWFAMAFSLLVVMQPRLKQIGIAGCILIGACLLFLGLDSRPPAKTVWSPYQKLQLFAWPEQNYQINVNNSGYMSIANLSPENLRKNPELAERYAAGNSYDAPFRFVDKVGNVLIVGSGAGNDVAAALRHGADHVDAVEIDPAIYNFGLTLHPENPYKSSRVRVILDDARNYLRESSDSYDLIIFGLLDSHTQSSNMSNMRIDNYVYTRESFQDAKRLLKPTGVLVLKFEVRAPHEWMGQRFFALLDAIFARPPITFHCEQVASLFPASVFMESPSPSLWFRAASPELASFVSQHPASYALGASDVEPTTDDWPYLYQRTRAIPKMYWSLSAILLLIAFMLVRKSFPLRKGPIWEFFFLGAGFLLLETQMVSRLALYFGSTWLVNCIALSFILLVLLAATVVVEKRKSISLPPIYGTLVASLVAIYVMPWSRLPLGSRAIGLFLVAAFAAPLFCAGIIFTERFKKARGSATVFGANVLGAVAGGLMQNLSFILGMKALLLFGASLYAIAGVASLFNPSSTISRSPAAQSSP